MSTTESADDSRTERYETLRDQLDPRLEGRANCGCPAARTIMLSNTAVPNHVLAAAGIEIPHREYIDSPDDARTYPTTLRDGDSVVHLHQDVRERTTDAFGSFGSADEDTDDVTWTVVGLDDGTVDLTVVGDWSRRRHVPHEDFFDGYEPLTLADGQPQWGY